MIGKCFVQLVIVLLRKSPFASTGELINSPVFVLVVSQTLTLRLQGDKVSSQP